MIFNVKIQHGDPLLIGSPPSSIEMMVLHQPNDLDLDLGLDLDLNLDLDFRLIDHWPNDIQLYDSTSSQWFYTIPMTLTMTLTLNLTMTLKSTQQIIMIYYMLYYIYKYKQYIYHVPPWRRGLRVGLVIRRSGVRIPGQTKILVFTYDCWTDIDTSSIHKWIDSPTIVLFETNVRWPERWHPSDHVIKMLKHSGICWTRENACPTGVYSSPVLSNNAIIRLKHH